MDIFYNHMICSSLFIGGDFNYILSQEEKKGDSYTISEMEDFMRVNNMHDLDFIGPKLTWTNNQDAKSKIYDRLD